MQTGPTTAVTAGLIQPASIALEYCTLDTLNITEQPLHITYSPAAPAGAPPLAAACLLPQVPAVTRNTPARPTTVAAAAAAAAALFSKPQTCMDSTPDTLEDLFSMCKCISPARITKPSCIEATDE
jgi:hypothetical protein